MVTYVTWDVLAVLKNYILGLLYACDVTHLQVNLHKGICKMNKTFCVMTVSNLTCLVGFKYTQIGPTTLFWDYTFMHYFAKVWYVFFVFFLSWQLRETFTLLQKKKSYKHRSFEESWRIFYSIRVSTEMLNGITFFNIFNNKKCFLSTKSAC